MLAQPHEEIEIVVSDNASDENYEDYVRGLADPRIIYHRQPLPVPVTDNWRQALSLATGDYVLMLGDDDALTPQFSEIVLPHLDAAPDLAYLAAYHYCYPGVMPGAPAGYFASVRCEFLQDDPGPFGLLPSYARELAGAVLDFRHRYNFNAQHFLLRRSFVDAFREIGGLYQSPYPDFFSAVALFWRAKAIIVLPSPAVIIGISPKSFGAYYFSQRQSEGYKFLDNQALTPAMREYVTRMAWPGDMNNTNWLISAEMARRALLPDKLPQVNVERYQAIQLVSLLRDKFLHGQNVDDALAQLAGKMGTRELITLRFLQAALQLTGERDKGQIIPIVQAAERELGQYPAGFYGMLDIGAHSSIADAKRWLKTGRPADIYEGPAEKHEDMVDKSDGSVNTHAQTAAEPKRPTPTTPEGMTNPTITARDDGLVWRLGRAVVLRTMPRHASKIAHVIKIGPLGILRGARRRAQRWSERLTGRGVTNNDVGDSALHILVRRGAEQCVLTPGLFDEFEFRHGDELAVMPARTAARLIRTPEGDVHIRAADGRGIRVPKRMEFTSYRGYQMPEHLARLTGAGSETFEPLGAAHIANYRKYVGLRAGMSFLEIGSGMGRDAFHLLDVLGPSGRYVGIDVQRESIVWCQKNISRDHANFRFIHFNAVHELHNPLGMATTIEYPLPAADRSVDRVAMQSVLTHIFEDEVVHYLREISRVLKPDGLAYVTFLLYSEDIVAASRKNNLTAYGLRFEHKYADGCYVDNAQYPTGGVAYTDDAMRRMINKAGLRLVRPYLKGQWSGYHAQPDDDGQDVAILGPAVTARPS